MKKLIAFAFAVPLAILLIAAGTQQSGPVQTSKFTRETLTNETAAGWRSKLGVGTSVDPTLTNQWRIDATNAAIKIASDTNAALKSYIVDVNNAATNASGVALITLPESVSQLQRPTNIFVGSNFIGNAVGLTNVPGGSITGSLTNNTTGNAATSTLATNANYVAASAFSEHLQNSNHFGIGKPVHINPRMPRVEAKVFAGGKVSVFDFGDNQLDIAVVLRSSFTNTLPLRTPGPFGDGNYFYRSVVGGTDLSAYQASQNGWFPIQTAVFTSSGGSLTNLSGIVGQTGWTTTNVTLQGYRFDNGAVITIRTQAFGGTLGTLDTFTIDNDGSMTYFYTNWTFPVVSNCVASLSTTGTNMIIALGQDYTAGPTFQFDAATVGGLSLAQMTATTLASNTCRAFFASNNWDGVFIHDINGTSSSVASNEWWVAHANFEAAVAGLTTDFAFSTPVQVLGDDGVDRGQREGQFASCRYWNRSLFDAFAYSQPTNRMVALGFYSGDGVHLTSDGDNFITSQWMNDFGISPDAFLGRGIKPPTLRTNSIDYTSLSVQTTADGGAKTIVSNYWSSGRSGISFGGLANYTGWNIAGSSSVLGLQGTNGIYLYANNRGDGFQGNIGLLHASGGLILWPSGGGSISGYNPGAGGISIHGGLTNHNTTLINDLKGGLIVRGDMYFRTSAPPTSVTVGVTAPDVWFTFYGTNGTQYYVPAFINH